MNKIYKGTFVPDEDSYGSKHVAFYINIVLTGQFVAFNLRNTTGYPYQNCETPFVASRL